MQINKLNFRNSASARLGVIVFLTFLLLIPVSMISGLIEERQLRRDHAIEEISAKWGEEQRITGPVLQIPIVLKQYSESDQDSKRIGSYVYFLPEVLDIQSNIKPEIRYRGIFKAILYNTQVKLRAKFSFPDFENLHIEDRNIQWEDAHLLLGIRDMKGIRELIRVQWNNQELASNPGILAQNGVKSGVSVRVPLDRNEQTFEFKSELNLNGSSGLMFVPIGKETNVRASSSWGTPSFSGNFLPVSREVSPAGFQAEWKILYLNRNFSQSWIGNKYNFPDYAFGVELMMPVDHYQKTTRTVKYALMFIALTFLSFFLVEILNKKKLHPIQYLMIGFANLLFYTLLLSFSEHIAFTWAYSIASVAVIALITMYTKSLFQQTKVSMVISAILIGLYGFLYIVLQLEDYALLMGSIGLFAALAVVMYLTRKLDWYSLIIVEKEGISQTE